MEEQRTMYKQLRPELRRNSCPQAGYASETAMALHAERRAAAKPAPKLNVGGIAWGVVLTLLSWKWSPQQIAATLKRVYPDHPSTTSRTSRSTRPSTLSPGGSCAAS